MILIVLSLVVALLLVLAGVIDFRSRVIPNWICLSIFFLYLTFLLAQQLFVFPIEPLKPLSSMAVGTMVGVVFSLLFFLKKLGGGDVKLITATAFWAGLEGITLFLLVMALSGGVIALVYLGIAKMKKTRQNDAIKGSAKVSTSSVDIPYGIAIAVSGLLCIKTLLTSLMA